MTSFFKQVRIELKLQLREPEAIFWGFFFPVIMIVVLGFLFSKKEEAPPAFPIGIAKELITDSNYTHFLVKLRSSKTFELKEISADSLNSRLITGELTATIKPSENQQLFIELPTINQPINERIRAEIEKHLMALNYASFDYVPWKAHYSEVSIQTKNGENVSYVEWLVPGVIALNLFLSCVFGIGINVVQDKRKGKLKKLATTPLTKPRFIMILSAQRTMILILQTIIITIAAFLIFGVTIQGSIFELFIILLISMLSFMVFGFMIAAVSNTIEKAVALSNLFFLVSMLVSGAYFSNAGLPYYLKFFTDLLPSTMAVDAFRGVFTYGHSVFDYPFQSIGLVLWVLISTGLSVRFFKWVND